MAKDTPLHIVEQLAEEFATRRRKGERITIQEFVAEHPAHGDALRDFLEALQLIDEFAKPRDGAPSTDTHSPGAESAHGMPSPIGPYQLLKVIGEGGMGTVYMAEQHEPIHRTVAMKVIKLGMDTKAVLARFEAERRALAYMDHPGIAKVYEAGATADGRPYFVMEYIEGAPITIYCDQHRLSTNERLRLFVSLCEAVQHAHQKGIIHRDLKPSNVLVANRDGRPELKVIDFGVSKAMAQGLTGLTMFTEHGQIIGTPEYMSPEQADNSVDIDTRSDIYSLGVLLYEMLTGALPHDPARLRAMGLAEIQRIIREETPPKPSTKLSSLGDASTTIAHDRKREVARLARDLRGDLDWITMRALEKDRSRRYANALSFAEDIQRHLDHEPVQAGPPSAFYRVKKFFRKHRAAVSAALLVCLALAVGLSWAIVERNRAEKAAASATASAEAERIAKEDAVQARKLAERRETQAREDRDRVLRLSDRKLLADYTAEADSLWPAEPENIPNFEEWIRKATKLYDRLPLHEQSRLLLERQTGNTPDLQPSTDDQNLAPQSQKTASVDVLWQLDVLNELVDGLQAFGNAGGTIPEVQRRLEWASQVEELTVKGPDVAAAWAKAIDSIGNQEECPQYNGLVILPQLGLVPLDQNSRTGLWEFWHPRTGERPKPSPEWQPQTKGKLNRWLIDETTSLVFVLIPSGTLRMGAERPSLGVEFEKSSAELALRVMSVPEESTGALLKVIAGDRLLQLNEIDLTDRASLREASRTLVAGSHSVLIVERGESEVTLSGMVHRGVGSPNVDLDASPNELPIHDVGLEAFFLSKYEMTQAQWQRFVGTNPSNYGPEYDFAHQQCTWLNPVEQMSWQACEREVRRMGLRLPTEAQWEWAARGGTSTPWWCGGESASIGDQQAGNLGDLRSRSVPGVPQTWGFNPWSDDSIVHGPVGSFAENDFGLHDIIGNVSEWTADYWAPYDQPVEEGTGLRQQWETTGRVIRGGGFSDSASLARSSHRDNVAPTVETSHIGVRPAREIAR